MSVSRRLRMRQVEIPLEEVQFHPTSFCDADGRVFWWKGELYRGITENYANFCKKLFEEGVVQRLVDKKFLVDTELTNLTLKGYVLVLKHRRIPFVSYANEWCPEMLRDTGLLITDLMMELAADGLTIDADTWDMLFDQYQPVYVDFCSIMPANSHDEKWLRLFRDDFRSYFIYPLQLMAQGYGNLARWLLADYPHEAIHAEFAAFFGHRIYDFTAKHSFKSSLLIGSRRIIRPVRQVAHRGVKLIRSIRNNSQSNAAFSGYDLAQKLRQELESIMLPSAHTAPAEGEDSDPSLTASDEWTARHRSVHKVLSDLHPATVLDIGTGSGWFSKLAALLGSRVVALDDDVRCISNCYREARGQKLPILPLVMNISCPSPGHGICNQVIAPALQRLPCDMVLALSLVHLLVFEQYLNFEQISQTLAAFSKRWLLVEFPHRDGHEFKGRWSDRYPWYTFENFLDALGKWFRRNPHDTVSAGIWDFSVM